MIKEKQLCFNNNGKFNIMAVGDIHEKYVPDEKTDDFLRLVNKALDELKPDLAVLMGDLVSSHFQNEKGEREDLSPAQMSEELQRTIEPFASRGIPFAVVFGNHDGETGLPKETIFSLLQEFPDFLNFSAEGITGVGNCNL